MSDPFVQTNIGSLKAITHPVGYFVRASGCWEWSGAKGRNGYGQGWFGRRWGYAHRAFYERANGPIPGGMEIDHLCRNRACVNPAHLRACSHHENIFAPGTQCIQAANAAKTVCANGHPYDEANTYYWRDGRRCRPCGQAFQLVKRRTRKAMK